MSATTMIDRDDLTEAIKALGLRASETACFDLLHSFPHAQQPSLMDCVVKLAKLERCERDTRNLKRRIREACLPPFTPLDQFDWHHPRSVDRGLFNALVRLDFVKKAENVLLRGPSGVGKTTLAANLAWLAIQAGYRVRYSALSDALADLLRQESLPAFERRKKRYSTPDLLIIDELGYVPCDTRSADILYAIIASRHEKAATVITTNLSFKLWPNVFPGAACVGALVDRFVQHCHVLDIDADSWRRKMAEKRLKASKTRRAKKTTTAS